jgi:predicted DCC family thiol-disulfide oxidoreductase YuxK
MALRGDSPLTDSPVLLFDGDCGFCSRSVAWVLRHERCGDLRFASIGSSTGAMLLAQCDEPVDPETSGTMVLIEGKRVFVRSDAALRVAARLRWPWRWASAAIVVPRFLRDGAYRIVARHRRRLGGNACFVPTPEQESRFLDRESET